MSNSIKKLLIASFAAPIIFTGCVAQNGKYLSASDLNISGSSAMVEHEHVKSALAILIKKSAEYDRLLQDSQNLSARLNDSKDQQSKLIAKNEDLQTRLSILSEDIALLKARVDEADTKQKVEIIQPIKPKTTQESAADSTSSQTAPTVTVSLLPTKTDKKNKVKSKAKKPEKSKKEHAEKASESCRPSSAAKTDINLSSSAPETSSASSAERSDKSQEFNSQKGKIIVNDPEAYIRTKPSLLKKYHSRKVKNDEVLSYVSKSDKWYKLEDGRYLSTKVAIELSTNSKKDSK